MSFINKQIDNNDKKTNILKFHSVLYHQLSKYYHVMYVMFTKYNIYVLWNIQGVPLQNIKTATAASTYENKSKIWND